MARNASPQVPADTAANATDTVVRTQVVGPDGTLIEDPNAIGQGQTLVFAEIDRATSGEVVAAQGAGSRIYVVSYALIVASAVTVEWRSAATGISGAMSLAANGGLAPCGSPSAPLLRTGANEALNIQLGSGVQVSGHLTYFVAA